MKKLISVLKDENGQGMVEYGLVLGAIAVGVVAALLMLGPKILSLFAKVQEKITGVVS